MAEGIELDAAAEVAEEEGQPELPSIFSTTTRYVLGGVTVTKPAPDGSRVVHMLSGNGATIIEINLSQELCDQLAGALSAVEVVEEGDEEEPEDAGNGTD